MDQEETALAGYYRVLALSENHIQRPVVKDDLHLHLFLIGEGQVSFGVWPKWGRLLFDKKLMRRAIAGMWIEWGAGPRERKAHAERECTGAGIK